jgi:hypothetical protein
MGDADLHTAAQAYLDAEDEMHALDREYEEASETNYDFDSRTACLDRTIAARQAYTDARDALRAALAAATEPPHRLNAGERMTVTALLERVDAWVESVEGTPAPWALVGDMADFLRRLADGPVPDPQGTDERKPGLIGREDKLTETLTDLLREATYRRFDQTPVRERHRGRWFELRSDDGHVWRVDIVFDRIEGGS